MKITGVYKITNTVTGDYYIGSSKDVKRRWTDHKRPSVWKNQPNSSLYKDMQKLGINKFSFQVLAEVEIEHLKEVEQQFIEKLKPTYNQINAKGWDFGRYKERNKSDKGKESLRKANKKYRNQLCCYNGETLTLSALSTRFRKKGLSHPTQEAKKYLL